MTAADLQAAFSPVLSALRALGVRHYVAGSVASSIHGVARATLDIDVVADLREQHVDAFVEQLGGDYYVDKSQVRAAVRQRRSFNLIHLSTMFKVDVFAARSRAFDDQVFARIVAQAIDESPGALAVPLASLEDTVLAKLEWFRAGGEVSERQWSDVAGLLNVGGSRIDWKYLHQWATTLGVSDLLHRAEAAYSARGKIDPPDEGDDE